MNPDAHAGISTWTLPVAPSRGEISSAVEALIGGRDMSWAAGADVLVACVGTGSTTLARAVAGECAAVIGRGRSPERVSVVASAGQVRDWLLARSAGTRGGAQPPAEISLRSCCVANGVLVAADWLLPTALVVVGEWHSSLLLGHSAVLDELPILLSPMRPAPNTLVLEHLYEAHRLLKPDLCLACARLAGSGDTGLIADESDIDVEAAAATLAGENPNALPQLSFIARHQAGAAPSPGVGWAGAGRRAALTGACRITEAWADVRRLPRNSRRIADAVARRVRGPLP